MDNKKREKGTDLWSYVSALSARRHFIRLMEANNAFVGPSIFALWYLYLQMYLDCSMSAVRCQFTWSIYDFHSVRFERHAR